MVLGVRQRVAPDNKLPRNWQEFLRVDQNKQELFKYLAECVTSIDAEKQVISTHGKQVLSIMPISRDNIGRLAPCNHEEADTRMLLHAADAVQCGFTKILLRTVDTDVLILAIAFVEKLQEFQGNQTIELWVGFGTGAHIHCIAAHDISSFKSTSVLLCIHRVRHRVLFLWERQEDSNGHMEVFS